MPKQVHIITRDDLPHGPIDHIDLVSDAAVHVEKEKGAICWHAVTSDNRRLSLNIPIEVSRNSYSYRHELIGIYEGLSELTSRRRQIKRITCHCDNEAGIDKIQRHIYSPSATTSADMDVILAIKKIVNGPEISMTFQHVKGHADKDKPKHKCTRIEQINIDCDEEAEECKGKPKHKCTRIEQINIDCDEEAEECVQSNIIPTPYHPLPGSKCVVRIAGTWISNRVDKAMQ
jgi:hypothetical protein